MYMRLGWVVGNAGLWGAIAVIVLAHVISITTGLSVASISTDKKVGVGGVYYILSRSLGLPMGGAIGLTLFVATSFSIALYLIGFAENFNPVLDLGDSINSYRVSATLALLILTVLGYISTSIALKSQYIILGAIGLSLISIFFGSGESAPEAVPLLPAANSVNFEVIFAIFFPAVTGFTAGIAMSGDLRDPKRDIPLGTMLAIGVGFLVYIGLAVYLAYNVDPQVLMTDYNIMMKIALFAPFVIAGIWGATLSSALGGILGGPRILQAMAYDRVIPFYRTFAKGSGDNNEPRKALLLTIAIAEVGILIGELDVIARIVSMFYLAAYNFINLSFFLEKWVSIDFSPRFKVSKWVGLAGFIATFVVMFKLDLLAMLIAYVILAVVYFYLKRREISLNTGDIWGGVWSTVVKAGLKRMEAKEEHQRNWRPNILLFSGGTEARPYLLELSKALTGKAGMVSNFDLIENPEARVLFPKREQAVKDATLREEGIFARRQEVKDVYKGIETIASTYGFSGIEPNTVMMGWPRNSQNPKRFAKLTQTLIDLDYNVIYVDYDRKRGFGKYANIDVWWRGISNNVTLMMKLVKLLINSEKWRNADVRVLLVIDEDADRDKLEKNIHAILEDFRIRATIKLINNTIDRKPFFELMEYYSAYADLVFLGIPEKIRDEENYVKQTNHLVQNIGTTLMIRASSQFSKINLGLDESPKLVGELKEVAARKIEPLELPFNSELNREINRLENALFAANKNFAANMLSPLGASYVKLFSEYRDAVNNFFERLSEAGLRSRKFPEHYREAFIELQQRIISGNERFLKEKTTYFEKILAEESVKWYELRKLIFKKSPITVKRILTRSDLTELPTDKPRIRRIKRWKRMMFKLFGKAVISIDWEDLMEYMLLTRNLKNEKQLLYDMGMIESHCAKTFRNEVLYRLEVLFDSLMTGSRRKERITAVQADVDKSISELLSLLKNLPENLLMKTNRNDRDLSMEIVRIVERLDVNSYIEDLVYDIPMRKVRKVKKEIREFPRFWSRNQHLFGNVLDTSLVLSSLHIDLRYLKEKIEGEMKRTLFNAFKQITSELKVLYGEDDIPEETLEQIRRSAEQNVIQQNPEILLLNITEQIRTDINHLPATVELFDEDSLLNFADFQEEEVRQMTVDLQNLVDYFIELDFIEPLNRGVSRAYNLITTRFEDLAAQIGYFSDLLSVEDSASDEIAAFRKKLFTQIDQLEQDIEQIEREFFGLLNKQFDDVNSKLKTDRLLSTMKNPERYVHLRKRYKGLTEQWTGIAGKLQQAVQKLLKDIRRRKHRFQVAEYAEKSKVLVNKRKVFRDFTLGASLQPEVEKQLPNYYKHLFSGKQVFSKHSVIPRESELKAVNEALVRHRNGEPGAIMIIGEPMIGKSHLTEQIVNECKECGVIRITSPIGGYDRSLSIINSFISAAGASGSIIQMMNNLPDGTVFVINDLELWWLRHPDGVKQIEQLIWLIERYGSRHLFLVNMNVYAYDLLRQIVPIEQAMLLTLVLPPVDRRKLADLLWERNLFAGMRIEIENLKRDKAGKRDVMKIMRRCAELSGGNPGAALHLWLSGIVAVENEFIRVRQPRPVSCPVSLPHTWAMALLHIVLHRHLSMRNILRIFAYQDDAHVKSIVTELINSGLIVQAGPNIYAINPFVEQAVIAQLKSQQYLKKY